MPIKIYKTQAFNQIFLCFEAKHKKHKTQTQIFGLHAYHKSKNQHRNTTLPQIHKPKNQHTPQTHKPISTKLTTHKPIVGIHISTTIYTTELRDREMKEPFGSEFEQRWDHEIREFRIISTSQPLIWAPIPNRWLGFRTTESYQIGDYGELPNRWTFVMGFLSLMAAATSLSLEWVQRQRPYHWDLREFGSNWSLAVGGDEILREFGSERDFVKGEERKRKLKIERV